MDPLTAGAIISAVGTVFSTISSIGQANASASQDKELAKQSMDAARQEEFADRRRSAQAIAKQQAGAAASGLDPSSGTPLSLLMDSAFNAEMNALNIRKRGEYDSAFYKDRARRSKAQIPGLVFGGLTKLAGTGIDYWQKTKP